MAFDEFYSARKVVEDILKKDLLGPVKENEVLDDEAPQQYYATGILYPQRELRNSEENEEMESEDINEGINLSNSFNQSSMAISTTIKSDIQELKVLISYAYYLAEEKNSEVENSKTEYLWKRNHFDHSLVIDINNDSSIELQNNLYLQTNIQMEYDDGSKTITVSLINKNESKDFINDNQNSFFQPELQLLSIREDEEIFIPRRMKIGLSKDKEIKRFEMLYSHINHYAVGHGCSVNWEEGEEYAYKVFSSFIPEKQIRQMKPAFNIDDNVFSINRLANGDKQEIVDNIERFMDSYQEWINEQEDAIDVQNDKFEDVAIENIKKCRESRDRILKCIDLLEENDILEAFKLANEAMFLQRKKYLERNGINKSPDDITWYPFQLAFILQVIPSIVNPDSDYRDIVDLLWFPTGGGKTEAYLGLAAFTIFYRRLSSENGGGVTIMMRYTLRLLTVQQFERASALIAACDLIRQREMSEEEEISIGLWVGGGLTPNRLKDAQENLERARSNERIDRGNPCQLLICPWCGETLSPANYQFNDERHSIKCGNENCEFNEGLPIYLVDDKIYDIKPTFIISTIDKYARMTWEPKAGNLFGINSKYDPPELIIQDELHLISGPLGTIAGLYEIAVKKFTEKNGINAKVVASTATITNAKDQIESLYASDHRQFPPQGLDIRDSYYAEMASLDEEPGRKYLGLLGAGKSDTTMLIRIYAALLFATRYLMDLDYSDEVIDKYWTIVGYFNSLRELGGAISKVLDDVQKRFEYLYKTKFRELTPEFQKGKETYDLYEELTSRKKNSEISEIIQKRLKICYPEDGALHFVLATNMISVGVDVDRLSLMVVNGQPKTNAENIQATSRIGRAFPGLVLQLYHVARSRDRSHYEQFVYYHSALYKFVEATSLTPFSDRAREKALDAVFISLCRHLIDQLRADDAADNFNESIGQLEEIKDYIIEHVEEVEASEVNDVLNELNNINEKWQRFSNIESNKFYRVYREGNGKPLLKSSESESGEFLVMNSMRNVDYESNVYLEEE